MSEFRIRPHPLTPNKAFLEAHKKMQEPHKDLYGELADYKARITLLFSDLPSEHKFWLQSGTNVKNLHELYEELDTMKDDIFLHHVGHHRNDFADWVQNTYQDRELADRLRHAKSRQEAKRAIEARIDSLLAMDEQQLVQKGFFNALITKLTKQNEQLQKELGQKKDWLDRRQKALEDWERRNAEKEKSVLQKFSLIEQQEKLLFEKFKKLQNQEAQLSKALEHQKKMLEHERLELERQNKERQEEHKRKQAELEHEKRQHEMAKRRVMFKQHDPVYQRIDELMSYATACVFNKNYKEAKDAMAKVKYYYNSVPNEDPKKREFYAKIIRLRNHLTDSLHA